jgi:hypothetical protein
MSLYDRDFFAWANEQAALLRAGRLAAADIDTIAEEIESVSVAQSMELRRDHGRSLLAGCERDGMNHRG